MRDIPVGNGKLLVNFDDRYQIRDIYFPHVGQENHTEGFPFRIGIWAEGEFSWVFSDEWERSIRYLDETLVTDVELTNDTLAVGVDCSDTVASHENVFLRRLRIRNLARRAREFRIFLHHDFRIYENKVGDTAFYDPSSFALIHYKKHRYFLINTKPHFDAFATGRKAFRDQEGTWRDAEDGHLAGGAITEGSVDSTIAVHCAIDAGAEYEFHYWIAAGTTHGEVIRLNSLVLGRGPEEFLTYTANYWSVWVNKNDTDLEPLPPAIAALYKRSLLIINTQIDDQGAILAANDSAVTERATDHYSYLWTRDGALVANALDAAGYPELTRNFFALCSRIVHEDGYFLQKYNADGTVASGWHAAWDVACRRQLVPIQEDETALVLWALWDHYERYRDIDFAHRLYSELVIACADFMSGYRDPDSGLPLPSWNLWEDRRGVHTFTCATVVAGLRAAARFADLFAETARSSKYAAAADEVRAAMRRYLYDESEGRFLRSLEDTGSELKPDDTIDASLFGVFYFGCFDPSDEAVKNTMEAVESKLASGGGIARFENDAYMRTDPDSVGNPWVICTLWLAEYQIACAKSRSELARPLAILEWVAATALPSGVLAEQIDPQTGAGLSVAPLTWSHSTFVATVHHYLERHRALS